MDQTIKNMQVRMPRRQQIFSQTLMPIAKNRFTTLRQSSESDYDDLTVDETPFKSELCSIADVNEFIHVADQSSTHKVSYFKSDQNNNENPSQKFTTQMQTERLMS